MTTFPSPVAVEGNDTTPLLPSDDKLRFAEWALIYAVPFGASMMASLFVFATAYHIPLNAGGTNGGVGSKSLISVCSIIVTELVSLGLLWCVLKRRGLAPREFLGFSFSWRDIPVGIGLALVSYVVYAIALTALRYGGGLFGVTGGGATPQNLGGFRAASQNIPAAMLLFAIVNPFAEEGIARAFTQREMEALLRRGPALAAFISVLLQAAYHLYQGIYAALALAAGFSVYAAFYARCRRAMPVVIAHLVQDVAVTLLTAAHHR